MALHQEKIFTIEDIYTLPEGGRAELINGHCQNHAVLQQLNDAG